jgi:hypothetical protein
MEVIFSSSDFYLSVLLCVFICYAFDIFVESWRFEVYTGPADLLRMIINKNKKMEDYEEEINNIF